MPEIWNAKMNLRLPLTPRQIKKSRNITPRPFHLNVDDERSRSSASVKRCEPQSWRQKLADVVRAGLPILAEVQRDAIRLGFDRVIHARRDE
jgi:hypothetical protein